MDVNKIENKTIACIFAHPDDESFGPGGTIALLARKNDVYVICATKGEEGMGEKESLGETRSKELLESAKVLGVKKVIFLDFHDGTLCNNVYHQLASAIREKIDALRPEILLTFEPRGVSGHIDHVTVSMVTSYLFEELSYVKTILYYCHDEAHVKRIKEINSKYFIYFPPGYKASEIGAVVDTEPVWPIRQKAIYKHQSQKSDIERIMKIYKTAPKKERFLVTTK